MRAETGERARLKARQQGGAVSLHRVYTVYCRVVLLLLTGSNGQEVKRLSQKKQPQLLKALTTEIHSANLALWPSVWNLQASFNPNSKSGQHQWLLDPITNHVRIKPVSEIYRSEQIQTEFEM